MNTDMLVCKIEHHAVLFALLAKYALSVCNEDGKEAILEGVTRYGRERGQRMAKNAAAHGEELNLVTYQLYGEWVPESPEQMETGILRKTPTFQNWVAKCPWCEAWNKHQLLEFGKLYCINIDKAVFDGFHQGFQCSLLGDNLSFGGEKCLFDWGFPLSGEEEQILSEKRNVLGLSQTKDFTFHTAHILHTVGNTLKEKLGEAAEMILSNAVNEYIQMYGQPYYDILYKEQYVF